MVAAVVMGEGEARWTQGSGRAGSGLVDPELPAERPSGPRPSPGPSSASPLLPPPAEQPDAGLTFAESAHLGTETILKVEPRWRGAVRGTL